MRAAQLTAAAALVAGIAACGTFGTAVQADRPRQSIKLMTSIPLEDIPGKEANLLLVEVGPGWETASRDHSGYAFIYVLDGVVEIDAEGGEPRTVEAGEVFHKGPGQPMVGHNPSSTDGARFVVFQIGDQGRPLRIAAR